MVNKMQREPGDPSIWDMLLAVAVVFGAALVVVLVIVMAVVRHGVPVGP